jgi:pyrimidine deaminase RibD-like protein
MQPVESSESGIVFDCQHFQTLLSPVNLESCLTVSTSKQTKQQSKPMMTILQLSSVVGQQSHQATQTPFADTQAIAE